MIRNLVILMVASTMIVSCGKKKTDAPPVTPAETQDDKKIEAKDMTFSPQGSDSGSIPGLNTVNFEYDKSAITPESRAKLQENAEYMKKNSSFAFEIEGHCDRHGSIEYNLGLGERRAKAVKSYLVNLGVSAKRLKTISYGKEKLLDSAENESADAKNRRANFVVKQ